MSTIAQRALHWTPRALAILFTIFLSTFALDVFGEGLGLWRTIGTLLLHLVPSFVVLLALIVAWRRGRAGAALFVGLALFYVGLTRGSFPFATYLVISGPLLMTGLLFFIDARHRAATRTP